MRTIEATRTSAGSPADVWTLHTDGSAWPGWGAWSSLEVEGGGAHELGAVRVLVARPFRVRERVTEWVPEERFGDELVDGMSVRGSRGVVTLGPEPGGGTRVRWRSSYDRADPLTAIVLRLAVRDSCRRLAKAAGR